MTKGSPFEFDIRVSADKRRRSRGRRDGAGDATDRPCHHPDCPQPGHYRAPRAPDQLGDWLWFCKDHIREYNLKWNFFAGQTEESFQRLMEADRVWGRATRPFGPRTEGAGAWQRAGGADPQPVGGTAARPGSGPASRRLPASERRALEILDAREHWSRAEIRKQYKSLVKDLHPDLNGGDRADEDRLQEVVWAWDQIKDSRNFRD